MKNYCIAAFLLSILCLSGCGSVANHKTTKLGIAAEMRQASLSHAHLMRRQGKYQPAIIEYRKVMAVAKSEPERQQACLGIAGCLVKMKNYPAAIATLKPLPLPPESDMDRHVLAIAGEAMLRLGQCEEAESILEIALDDMEKTSVYTSSWMAGCCGNLGYAYLKNAKPNKAVILYRQTAKLYTQQGNSLAAHKARLMADDLKAIIQQYTPKTVPLTDELSR